MLALEEAHMLVIRSSLGAETWARARTSLQQLSQSERARGPKDAKLCLPRY